MADPFSLSVAEYRRLYTLYVLAFVLVEDARREPQLLASQARLLPVDIPTIEQAITALGPIAGDSRQIGAVTSELIKESVRVPEFPASLWKVLVMNQLNPAPEGQRG